VIPAGTPEDKELTAISNEGDQQKRITMLEQFVQTYASNPAAVAYGNWQLSQQYITSDPAKALGYGDKALAAMPDVIDILQSQTDVAQQLKAYPKVVDYAVRGATVIKNMEKQPRPDGVSAEDWASQMAQAKTAAQPVYDYLGTAAYNAMISENDAKKRLELIDRYTAGFAGTKLAQQANALGIATLQELGDMPRLVEFGEKALAGDPSNVQVLTLMANAYAEDQKAANLAKADAYARKAIELAKTDPNTPDNARGITEGFAHEILGYSLLRQDKTALAISELKTASGMLKEDATKQSLALYRLGYAYAKANRVAEAKQTLTEAAAIQGPFQQASKDLLAKVSAARAGKK